MKKYISVIAAFLLIVSCSKEDAPANEGPSAVVATKYTITISAAVGGSVSTAGGEYEKGKTVTVTASPEENYVFVGWSDGNTNATRTITADATKNITANFNQIIQPTLSLIGGADLIFTHQEPKSFLVSFETESGFKKMAINSEYGVIQVTSEPSEGTVSGTVEFKYTNTEVANVERLVTIAGKDSFSIQFEDNAGFVTDTLISVKTQPAPSFKNYLQPSEILSNSNIQVSFEEIRYLNFRDNRDFCIRNDNPTENRNPNHSNKDDLSAYAFADVNGDGYDDIILHVAYNNGNPPDFSSKTLPMELYLYENGAYRYYDLLDLTGNLIDFFIVRNISVGDFDNDGDPDFLLAATGTDRDPYPGEESILLKNEYLNTGSFEKISFSGLIEYNHGGASADIDNDGDLDILMPERSTNALYFNEGNFNFTKKIIQTSEKAKNFFLGHFCFELQDLNSDGFIDLISGGEMNFENMDNITEEGQGRVIFGNGSKDINTDDKVLIPRVQKFDNILDIEVYDIDNDGNKELIITRSGDQSGGFRDENDVKIGYYYLGYYIQICSVVDNKIEDTTQDFISDNFMLGDRNWCFPDNNTIFWLNIGDLDGNGRLDLWNLRHNNSINHHWEFNGNRFEKK